MKRIIILVFILNVTSCSHMLDFQYLRKPAQVSNDLSCISSAREFAVENKIKRIRGHQRPIILVTDTSLDMSNGVVTVVKKMTEQLDEIGISYKFISPKNVTSKVLEDPRAQGTAISYLSHKHLKKILQEENPIAVHIVTEGMIGESVRQYALQNKIPFSTFYHTAWPEFFNESFHVPIKLGEKFVSKFHSSASTVMAATDTMVKRLSEMGVPKEKLAIRSHGVDVKYFRPRSAEEILPEVKKVFAENEGPFSLFVGRISPEKSIQDFLDAEVSGTKIIVGDGPLLKTFLKEQKKGKHKNVVFTGKQMGESLAQFYSEADVFVFPSKRDTFGLVLLEAMASGTPVAAYPVQGPIDVITSKVGAMNDDLAVAITEALTKNPKEVREFAENYSWKQTAVQFVQHISEIPEEQISNLKSKMPMYQIVPLIVAGGASAYAIVYYLKDE